MCLSLRLSWYMHFYCSLSIATHHGTSINIHLKNSVLMRRSLQVCNNFFNNLLCNKKSDILDSFEPQAFILTFLYSVGYCLKADTTIISNRLYNIRFKPFYSSVILVDSEDKKIIDLDNNVLFLFIT